MTIPELFFDPFTHYAFMRRALAACVILALGGTPLGVFMTLRRMTLAGDAMSHAILPGVALAFLVSGLSIWPMTLGGLAAGVFAACAAVFLVRFTQLKEDAAFTLLYLFLLATGVTIVSLKGGSVDLLHLLFGDILAINRDSLYLVTGTACLSLIGVAVLYRWLVIEGFDPDFLKTKTPYDVWGRLLFYGLLMLNLIAAFQALGTLMALGLMILPAIAARFWSRNIDVIVPLGVLFALVASVAGLLVSYHANVPSGPAVVLTAGLLGLASACIGSCGSVRTYLLNQT
ncbi:MAG: metal ABC transporter permease [Alphaproteobacteria bacterium]|nr:metal ABC transporter permease [Alphaproteobacteria bacterium]